MSVEPFRRLVKLVARSFYDEEIPPKSSNRSKSDKSDNQGIAVVILDALTRRQWVKEDDLAKDLKLHPKQLRRTLRALSNERLIQREDRRETGKGAKAYNAAIAVFDGRTGQRESEKQKVQVTTYCCLDYAQVCDVVRYKIHRAKRKIKDQLEDRNAIQEYVCPTASCGRRYSALDAPRLMVPPDMNFHCERCQAELVAESDKLAAEELGDGDGEENARRRQRERQRELLDLMEEQLKPLTEQLLRVKDLVPPEYGTFTQWEKRAIAAGHISANGDEGAAGIDMKSSHGQSSSGTPLPFLGDTKVEVALAGMVNKTEVKEEEGGPKKVLPPWMIRKGMSLTAEQRGEVKQEVKLEAKLEVKSEENISQAGVSDDVKPFEEKENAQRKVQEAYLQAYYAALMQHQHEVTEVTSNAIKEEEQAVGVAEREVGQKAKREEEWEFATGGNEPAEDAEATHREDTGTVLEEDDVDWEDGD